MGDTVCDTRTNFVGAFSGGSDNGCTISGKGQIVQMDNAAKKGLVQETHLKDGKEGGIGLFVDGKVRMRKPFNQFLRRFPFHAVGFLSFLVRFFYLDPDRLNIPGKVLVRTVPKAIEEVIEGPHARRVIRGKAADNCVKRRDTHGVNPISNRGNAKGQREQIRTEHARWQTRGRAKDGIFVLHDGINCGQIKITELLINLPLGFRYNLQIWITGMEILSQGVPVRGVSADVYRFQSLRPPFR